MNASWSLGSLSDLLLSCSCQKFFREPDRASDAAETPRGPLSSPCSFPCPPPVPLLASAYFRDPVLGILAGRTPEFTYT